MVNYSSKREISPTSKPNNKSKSVTPTTEVSVPDNVESLFTEQCASYKQIPLSLPDFPCYNHSISPSSMPAIRLVDIQITIPTCIEKSTQSTKQHVLPKPKSKISKTNEPNSSSHAHQNTDGYSIDSSKMFSSLIPYKNIKVTPDLTPCQCCVRRREAIGLHGSVTVNNQLGKVCNTVNRLVTNTSKEVSVSVLWQSNVLDLVFC